MPGHTPVPAPTERGNAGTSSPMPKAAGASEEATVAFPGAILAVDCPPSRWPLTLSPHNDLLSGALLP